MFYREILSPLQMRKEASGQSLCDKAILFETAEFFILFLDDFRFARVVEQVSGSRFFLSVKTRRAEGVVKV